MMACTIVNQTSLEEFLDEQGIKHSLCIFNTWCWKGRLLSCKRTKADIAKGIAKIPALRKVVLYVHVLVSRGHAYMTDTLCDFSDRGIIDEIIQSQSIGVLEFEFVVVYE